MMSDILLEVQDLRVRYPVTGGIIPRTRSEVPAVDGVSLLLRRGETVGLVGESGSGKTTVGRAIVNVLRAMSHGVEIDGRVLYHGPDGVVDLATLDWKRMRPYRAHLQMIFQDPYSSLNPRMTVGRLIEEPLKIHLRLSRAERCERVEWLLDKVKLSPAHARRYPHEFSGGQRQRIGIARALATSPRIIVADEPVSALDVSIQAEVINLMQDLQDELGLSYVFISHDLSIVRHLSERIAVMQRGQIVECGPAEQIYHRPAHPYSQALLAALPRPAPRSVGRPR
jgi:ABC-type oligopeptide transport system ATPase subunit